MKTLTLSAFCTFSLLLTGTVSADDLCSVPEAEWQTIEALQSKLEQEGWNIKNIKVDDGCYEVYATDSEGKRHETYFDPKTFELIKED